MAVLMGVISQNDNEYVYDFPISTDVDYYCLYCGYLANQTITISSENSLDVLIFNWYDDDNYMYYTRDFSVGNSDIIVYYNDSSKESDGVYFYVLSSKKCNKVISTQKAGFIFYASFTNANGYTAFLSQEDLITLSSLPKMTEIDNNHDDKINNLVFVDPNYKE